MDEVDNSVDVQDGGGVAVEVEPDSVDSYGALQDRMAGDDSPWYSPSEGKVVTANGEVVVDPSTGLPFESMEAFEAANAKTEQQQNPAKPKTEQTQPEKPMSKKFENFISPDGNVSVDSLFELSKATEPFAYQNEAVPKVIEAATGAQTTSREPELDPIAEANAQRDKMYASHVTPIENIYKDMINAGVDPDVANGLLGKYYEQQKGIVDKAYKEAHDKALQDIVEKKTGAALGPVQERELATKSKSNVTALASKLYPSGGEDQFFALVNGTYNDKGEFERGPSARVLDIMVNIASGGKEFSSPAERDKAYKDTFLKLTSDPVMAKEFMLLAHNNWLGTKIRDVYKQGKESALKETARINKTIKTRPASFSQPQTEPATAGMPEMLRTIMGVR
jgi:hypothetical protein